MVQGRKPDLKRRQQVAVLRAQGLSLVAIARVIGASRQCVLQILQRMTRPSPLRSVTCCGCGQAIVSAGALRGDEGKALCLPCLEERPQTPFGQRLKALRLAAGLTQGELAARSGVTPSCLSMYEAGQKKPKQANLNRLIESLSTGFDERAACPADSRGNGTRRPLNGGSRAAYYRLLLGHVTAEHRHTRMASGRSE